MEAFSETNMQTGAIISGWGHLIVIGLAALSGPIFEDSKDNELSISEVSIVSLSEFDILQKRFEKDFDTPVTLINKNNDELLDDQSQQDNVNKEDTENLENEIEVDQDIAATSTPSIDSPELPEVVNSTPSGFDTNVSIVGEDVALNLDVPEGVKLESPDQNFDINVDTKPYPKLLEDVEKAEAISKTNSSEISNIEEVLAEDNSVPEQTITQPIIDALIAELSSAPMRSVRPKGRSLDDSILQVEPAEQVAQNEIIASISNEPIQSARNAPAGPPLTQREKDNLRVSVGRCWNKTSLSREALEVTVTILFNMSEAGYPESDSIKMVDSFGGAANATKIAYDTARRAILVCGRRGFDLPEEKYAQWKTIKMVFDPIKLRIK
ncbi:MAG: hypothetical protein P8J83_10530 [Paracoccaceae bacterium]|jgi:hypothetical protein|nr:hypothetical protein [Paracoccaceae bacterium]